MSCSFRPASLALVLFASVLSFSSETSGQSASLHATQYTKESNPLGWHLRKPHAAYWQQDVHYTIAARIDEVENSITATENLEYVNNSPDTLREVFFHLYQNAFINVSYLRNLEKSNGVKARLGAREAAGLGIGITGLTVNGQTPVLELDNTILKVTLPGPLLPGASATFAMYFKTWYDRGTTRRRMQMYPAWGFMHYNGCQWYPKMCVYDQHSGWNTDQHLGKEFYGDFGTFDVSLDFPSNYVVEATGAIQNRNEVLPADLRAKLDIKNFAQKKWDETPSIITPYVKGERKVWRYKADNVHDFAFTADPSYRIATAYWKGIECVGIAQEPHAAGWQNSAELVAKIIQTFSEDIGMYGYPKMVAADASDGMEYPMLTLDGGRDPGYRGLLVHEIGHNWFYGMVGSNETYRAALDEGFTQFLTAWGLRKIDGDTVRVGKPKGWYRRRFAPEPQLVQDRTVEHAYITDAANRNELPLETHSDNFHSALNHDGGYRQVYYKTATMLYNLEYTLGDSLFQRAMQHYFDQWKFAHPYFEDFRQSIIDYTGVNLNPFFDQWLITTKTIDYSVARVQQDGDSARITLSVAERA
jgi:aminopeptidase N